ncbi:hypothetical protein [Lysinibacillus sp. NPDC056185]|uniref:hypothetical protein n=1 Tax=Lysinibacillus sp. NPDC056185 TaxID=3345739 RepID=UPI0039EEB1E0
MTDQPTPDSLREQYAAAIRPAMLLGLQDAELDGEGGTQRINEWVDWIAEKIHKVRDREMKQLAAGRATWTAKALEMEQAAEQAEAALEQAELDAEQQARHFRTLSGERESYRQAWKDEQKRRATAEAAIERVQRLCDLTIAASVRVEAVQQARDTLAALDQPQQPTTTEA